ncbi:MAG: hypothetical protein LBT35_00615 [Tannerella sp.]|jgi:hypothetical protein|nr:hypothetical protein [Tannerella sp.]
MKVIFLDIDGVIQPCGKQDRFEHIEDIDVVYKELNEKFGIDYYKYNEFDVAAVYYDWNTVALRELRRIVDTTGAKIVISSDWKLFGGLQRMIDFMRIYDMAEYLIDVTPDAGKDKRVRQLQEERSSCETRSAEILVYLERHPEVTNYIAIDDMDLRRGLGIHAIITPNRLIRIVADRCIEILMSQPDNIPEGRNDWRPKYDYVQRQNARGEWILRQVSDLDEELREGRY